MITLYEKEWLDIKEASEYIGLSVQALHSRIRKGYLPKRIYNSRLLFLKEELDKVKVLAGNSLRLDQEVKELYGEDAMLVSEAAKYSLMSALQLRKRLQSGEIRSQTHGTSYVIKKEDLDAYIRKALKID